MLEVLDHYSNKWPAIKKHNRPEIVPLNPCFKAYSVTSLDRAPSKASDPVNTAYFVLSLSLVCILVNIIAHIAHLSTTNFLAA